jgi:hypothetical protein
MMMKRERLQKTESCCPSVKPANAESIFAPRPFSPPVEEHEAPAAGHGAGFNFADISIFPPQETVQPKLVLGPIGDRYEQEADRVARQVVETISSSDQESVQRQEDLEDEDELDQEEMLEEEGEELIQGKFASGQTGTLQAKEEAPPNKTGLPDHLKSGLESLSGMDFSGVRVHYNSPKPAQLSALAYTQGREIHLAPGQERHLPHEGWHAVQQMQGRVKPTMVVEGTPVNEDSGLEKEADVMGGKAVQLKDGTCQECRPDNPIFARVHGEDRGKTRQESTADLTPIRSIQIQNKKNGNEINRNRCDNVLQLMGLTPLGANVAQSGGGQRAVIAVNLMAGANIITYVPAGICYDTVAFVRYLLGAAITPRQLVNTAAQAWLPLFDFTNGNLWMGGAIPAGTAVGFERLGGPNPGVFHAALAIGGTTVRGVNGLLLGTGWQVAGDRNIATLAPDPLGAPNTYVNPNGPPGLLQVWLSNL